MATATAEQATTTQAPIAWRTKDRDTRGFPIYGFGHGKKSRWGHVARRGNEVLVKGEHKGAGLHTVQITPGGLVVDCNCAARPGTCWHLVVARQFVADGCPGPEPVEVTPEPEPVCARVGCQKPAHRLGLCAEHLRQADGDSYAYTQSGGAW